MKKKTKAKSTSTKTKAIAAKTKTKPELVMLVYGLGEAGQPCAGVFAENDFGLARKGAKMLNLSAYVAKFEMIASSLKGIKAGNVYAPGGKGFVPTIQAKRFEELLTSLKLEAPKPKLAVPDAPLPANWDGIDVGHLVIAQADDPSLGFWPTLVEAIDGEMLLLRACDFPDITVTRHRYAVALAYTPTFSPPTDFSEVSPGLGRNWANLKPGDLVLGQQSVTEGWWEALIAEVDDMSVVLRWRDHKTLPKFRRSISQIGLLCPQLPKQPAQSDDNN